MRCDEAGRALEEWLDDELNGHRREEWEAHLEVCEVCRRERDELSEVTRLLHEVGETDRPAARSGARPPAAPIRPSWWGRPWWVGPIAAAALVLLALLPLPWPGGERPLSTTESRESEADEEFAQVELELTAGGDDLLAVRLPSESPHIHIFWIYDTEKRSP